MKAIEITSAPPGIKFYYVDLLGIVRWAPVVAFEHHITHVVPKPVFPVEVAELSRGIPWAASAYLISGEIFPLDPTISTRNRKSLSKWSEWVVEERLFMRKEYWHQKKVSSIHDGVRRFPTDTYWRVDYPHVSLFFRVARGIDVPEGDEHCKVHRVRRERWYDMLRAEEGMKEPWPMTKDVITRHNLTYLLDATEPSSPSAPVRKHSLI